MRSILALFALGLTPVFAAAADEELLTIGSTAPELDVDHWFDLAADAEGEAPSPITEFEPGQVYLVEFWATWCGPCVMSIPHVAELQESYRDRGVTIMSISSEDVETIEPFFEREVMNYEGDAEETPKYADLMAAYRVGADPDRSVATNYMQAAAQSGIPCAFLVGKTGQIEWIGHPMAVDEALGAVVDDSWDRDAFAEQFKLQQRMQQLQGELSAAIRRGQFDEARALAAEFAELTGQPEFAERIGYSIDFSEFLQMTSVGDAAAGARFDKLVEAFDSDPAQVNDLAWRVFQIADAGRPVEPALMRAVTEKVEEVLDPAPSDLGLHASLLDTAAHLRHLLGDLDTAIAQQERAVELAADLQADARREMAGYLEELKAAKSEANAE